MFSSLWKDQTEQKRRTSHKRPSKLGKRRGEFILRVRHVLLYLRLVLLEGACPVRHLDNYLR